MDRALELQTAFQIPFQFGGVEVPPLAIGTASLLEVGAVDVFRTQEIENAFGVAKLLYALTEREKCAALFFKWREWMESDKGKEFDIDDSATFHTLDFAVEKFALKHKLFAPKTYTDEKVLKLFEYVFVSFNGFLLIPENNYQEPKWLFDMPSVASQILIVGKSLNLSYFDSLWRFPVSMASHLASQQMKANGAQHIERPASQEYIDAYRQLIFDRETKGQMHPWQFKDPVNYDLSPYQVHINERLVDKLVRLRKAFNKLKGDKLEAHQDKWTAIMVQEVNDIKQQVGIED